MADRHRFGGPELPDRTSPLSLHAAAQLATLPAPDQGILPAARTALLRGELGWLLCPGPAPSQPRRPGAPFHHRAVLKAGPGSTWPTRPVPARTSRCTRFLTALASGTR